MGIVRIPPVLCTIPAKLFSGKSRRFLTPNLPGNATDLPGNAPDLPGNAHFSGVGLHEPRPLCIPVSRSLPDNTGGLASILCTDPGAKVANIYILYHKNL